MAPKRAREGAAGEAAMAKYELGNVLGEGAFAVVHLAVRKRDSTRFAMKLISKNTTSSAEAEHELKILSTLGMHRHIVSLVDHFELPESTAIVMELAAGGEVFEQICEKGAYSEADAADVVRQVALALAFMHSVGVVHRDLKPENLLLTTSNDVKVADFGLAALCGAQHPPLTAMCGTATYLAPEVITASDDEPYGVEADMFSLGGVLFALLGGYVAFDPHSNRDDTEVTEKIISGGWSFDDFPGQWKHVSKEAKDLIRSLLTLDPTKRITADGVLLTRWATGEGVSDKPIPGSDKRLQLFNGGRQVWRAAIHAAGVFAKHPQAGAHYTITSQRGKGKAPRGSASKKAPRGSASKKAELPAGIQEELRKTFNLFDIDGDGSIDAEEMKQVVRSLGAKESDAQRILEEADTDGDGSISFDEFCCLVQPLYDNSGAALREAFDMFDADGSGYIDREELSLMLRKLGFEWQGSSVFAAADTDGDGKVSYEEFLAVFGKVEAAKIAKPAVAQGSVARGASTSSCTAS